MNRSEELREALLYLDEAKKREQQERKMSDALLAGLHAIVMARGSDEIFRKLFDILCEPLGFEAAFVLRENSDGTMTAVASSEPSFADTVWQPQAMFERVFAGQPVAVYDTELVDEWRSQPDPVKQRAKSALHFAIHTSEPRVLFVCTHSERAYFSQQHVTLARRFSVLAMQALQKIECRLEITDLQQSERQIKHLNLVLRAVRNVNQLITQEKDRDRLLKGACKILTEDRGYANVWIALFDGKQRAIAAVESGLGASFEPMVERLRRGELTHCAKAAFALGEVIVEDPVTECADCPLASGCSGRTGVSARLEHKGKVYGLLSVSVPLEFAQDEEERSLFREVAGDIAFALHNMDLEDERKQAEAELRESEEKYRLLAENTLDCIWQMGLDAKFIYVNSAIFQMFGFTVEEWVGSSLFEHCSPEDMKVMMGLMAEAIKKGKADGITFETHLFHKNGKEINIEIIAKLMLDKNKNPLGFQGTTRNITERKQAEAELRESESRHKRLYTMLRLMCDNLPELIWAKDLQSRFLFANKSCCDNLLNAKDTDEPIGRDDAYFGNRENESHPENPEYHTFHQGCMDSDNAVLEAQEAVRSTESGKIKGNVTVVDVYKAPLWDEKGNLIGTVGCARDITRERDTETQLRQAQKMESVGRLAGGVAHDFNNLLTGISGYTEFVIGRVEEGSSTYEDLTQVSNLAKRAADLTRQLLAFSRRQTLRPVALNMNTVIADITKMLGRLIGEDIALDFKPASDLDNVEVDPGQFEQVLLNLAINARDAMPKGGKLIIETANVELDQAYADHHVGVKPGPYIRLAVTDSGCGMDAATCEHIFEPFFTTKEEGKGTGLGLSTVYGIVKQHGGNVWMYSVPGKGTTFKIYLPRVSEPEEEVDTNVGDELIPRGTETILVAEDNQQVREITERFLIAQGYEMLSAATPDEAEELLLSRGDEVALLLTDVVMPGRSGRELYDSVRESYSSLKVLYMSGYTDNAIVHHGVLKPGTPFIQKPFTMKDLAAKVRKVLDSE